MEQNLITADEVRLLSALAHARALPSQPTAVRAGAALAGADGADRAADAVASMNAAVDYVEMPTGRQRTVVLVHPADADASAGRVSVLSPVGRALLGCAVGDHAEVQLPNGQPLRLLVAGVRLEARDG